MVVTIIINIQILFVTSTPSASAQEVSKRHVPKIGSPIKSYDGKKKYFYHWGQNPWMQELINEKNYSTERWKFFNSREGVAGVGIYVADTPWGSAEYAEGGSGGRGDGPNLLEVHIENQTPLSFYNQSRGWYVSTSRKGITFHHFNPFKHKSSDLETIGMAIATNGTNNARKFFISYLKLFQVDSSKNPAIKILSNNFEEILSPKIHPLQYLGLKNECRDIMDIYKPNYQRFPEFFSKINKILSQLLSTKTFEEMENLGFIFQLAPPQAIFPIKSQSGDDNFFKIILPAQKLIFNQLLDSNSTGSSSDNILNRYVELLNVGFKHQKFQHPDYWKFFTNILQEFPLDEIQWAEVYKKWAYKNLNANLEDFNDIFTKYIPQHKNFWKHFKFLQSQSSDLTTDPKLSSSKSSANEIFFTELALKNNPEIFYQYDFPSKILQSKNYHEILSNLLPTIDQIDHQFWLNDFAIEQIIPKLFSDARTDLLNKIFYGINKIGPLEKPVAKLTKILFALAPKMKNQVDSNQIEEFIMSNPETLTFKLDGQSLIHHLAKNADLIILDFFIKIFPFTFDQKNIQGETPVDILIKNNKFYEAFKIIINCPLPIEWYELLKKHQNAFKANLNQDQLNLLYLLFKNSIKEQPQSINEFFPIDQLIKWSIDLEGPHLLKTLLQINPEFFKNKKYFNEENIFQLTLDLGKFRHALTILQQDPSLAFQSDMNNNSPLHSLMKNFNSSKSGTAKEILNEFIKISPDLLKNNLQLTNRNGDSPLHLLVKEKKTISFKDFMEIYEILKNQNQLNYSLLSKIDSEGNTIFHLMSDLFDKNDVTHVSFVKNLLTEYKDLKKIKNKKDEKIKIFKEIKLPCDSHCVIQ
jgi:hypothetical protein